MSSLILPKCFASRRAGAAFFSKKQALLAVALRSLQRRI
jgi:hypothetical protein